MTVLESFDGKKITIHEWLDVEHPVGIVQIIHGMAEHAARYEAFARFLNAHGFLVVADDHRGHGETDSATLGYCQGNMFADTVHDEAEITGSYRKRYPSLRYLVFGFSYGSFLTQSYIGKYGHLIDGAVIAGSNYKKDFEVYLGALVAGAGCLFVGERKPARLIERLSFGAYAKRFPDGEWVSADAENNARYHKDPLCGFTCSNRFYADFFCGLKRLYTKRYREGLNRELPLLLVSGAEDPVGEMGAGVRRLARFYQDAGVKRVELALFSHARHEFLNEEQDREQKYGTVLRFLEGI